MGGVWGVWHGITVDSLSEMGWILEFLFMYTGGHTCTQHTHTHTHTHLHTSRGMSPKDAVSKFLREVRKLDFYGILLFYIKVRTWCHFP